MPVLLSGCGGYGGQSDASADAKTSNAQTSQPSAKALSITQTPLHRLNRTEYNNTTRDLLAVDLKPANRFPPDSATEGFDNVASSLVITPALFDAYFESARLLVEAAIEEFPAFTANIAATDGQPRMINRLTAGQIFIKSKPGKIKWSVRC